MHQVHFNNFGSTNVYTSPCMKQKLFIPQHPARYQLVVSETLCPVPHQGMCNASVNQAPLINIAGNVEASKKAEAIIAWQPRLTSRGKQKTTNV
jgi:hypothetical protein